MADLVPTARLRWVEIKPVPESRFGKARVSYRMLQQWWAPDVPGYMGDPTQGEWRDVATEEEE